ncbi:hypothetical protein ABOM_010074, partial [Aspergillus bombycis]
RLLRLRLSATTISFNMPFDLLWTWDPHYVVAGSLFVVIAIPLLLQLGDPLSSVPGPFWARWSPLWMINHALRGDMHGTMIQLHDKHGSLVRTGPNEVSTSNLDAIQLIYGPASKFHKSDWYSVWQGRRKFDLFPERDAKVHAAQRRLVNSVYCMSGLKEPVPYLDDVLNVYLVRLSQTDTRCIDMSYWVQLFAFDVIGELTFSKRFGFIDTASDKGTFAQIERALQSAAWIGQVPWVYWVYDWLSPWIGNHLGITNRHGLLRQIATVIGTNPWVIHRNKQIFGEDADVFRPERWLEGNASRKERFFFAFGAGSRTCIGKSLGLLEISKVRKEQPR